MEQWKDIPEYEGLYQVSSEGRVRNLDRIVHVSRNRWGQATTRKKPSRVLSSHIGDHGYYSILLTSADGTHKRHTIHRLVGMAFLPNPENKEMIDHIDRNKINNLLSNLRWATRSENCLNNDKEKTSTGESYIYTSFRVCIPGHRERRFKTLPEAVAYRDSLVQ